MIPRKFLPATVRQAVYRSSRHTRGITSTTPRHEGEASRVQVDQSTSNEEPGETPPRKVLYPKEMATIPKPRSWKWAPPHGHRASQTPSEPTKGWAGQPAVSERSGKLAGLPNYTVAQAERVAMAQRRAEFANATKLKRAERMLQRQALLANTGEPVASPSTSSVQKTKAADPKKGRYQTQVLSWVDRVARAPISSTNATPQEGSDAPEPSSWENSAAGPSKLPQSLEPGSTKTPPTSATLEALEARMANLPRAAQIAESGDVEDMDGMRDDEGGTSGIRDEDIAEAVNSETVDSRVTASSSTGRTIDGAEAERATMEEVLQETLSHPATRSSGELLPPSTLPGDVAARGSLLATDVKITEVRPKREMKVATLRSQLRRVLFSPGVHALQDPRTGMWNFDPEQLHDIPKPEEFAYNRSPPYIRPSLDEELAQMANDNDCQFTGSTSTLTKALSQIYFAISGGKGVDLSPLSQAFADARPFYAAGATLPATLIIGKSKINPDKYYVDTDKGYDVENVLSRYGVILERMLISDAEEFRRYLKSSPDSAVSQEERKQKEAYMYQKASTILMRSQLDCYDPQLPGTGVFDIKTRACAPIRFDRANYVANSVFDISKDRGFKGSYEKEYYDLIKSGMLKFSMQVRIGKMDGIFVAYHNTNRIFGFQYLPLSEMDERLFGSTELADQAFQLTVGLLETLMKEIIECFPGEDVRVTIAANNVNPTPHADRYIAAFVQPVEWDSQAGIRPIRVVEMGVESLVDGEVTSGPVEFSVDPETRKSQQWTVNYTIKTSDLDVASQAKARVAQASALDVAYGMLAIPVPEGKTPDDMQNVEAAAAAAAADVDVGQAAIDDEVLSSIRWVHPPLHIVQLRAEAKASGEEYERRKAGWKLDGDRRSWVDL